MSVTALLDNQSAISVMDIRTKWSLETAAQLNEFIKIYSAFLKVTIFKTIVLINLLFN